MPVGFDSIRAGAAGAAGGYEIDYSCRFNDNDNAYLQKTFGSPTDATNWTFSCWIKRCTLGTEQYFFSATTSAFYIRWGSDDKIRFRAYPTWDITTTAVFRDTAAWYHLVAKFANGAVTLYMNNTSVGSASVADATYNFFTNAAHTISSAVGGSNFSDHYMAEVVGIDGTAYNPSDFAETNDNGVWVPKDVSGLTFGDNGFWLDFANSSALGNDVSGNNNDWASSGLATNDQVTDTPTDNFCVINGIAAFEMASPALANGNLDIKSGGGSLYGSLRGTMVFSSGKWYWEIKATGTITAGPRYGIASPEATDAGGGGSQSFGNETTSWSLDLGDGQKRNSGTSSSYGSALSTNDVLMIAVDADNSKIWWGKNDTWFASGDPAAGTNAAFTNLTGVMLPAFEQDSNDLCEVDFGQLGFAYTPPTGFVALSTANLAAPALKDPSTNFQTELYTGNGTAIGSGGKAVTFSGNSAMQPDIVWIKNRDQGDDHANYDAARGTTKQLEMNNTDAETTEAEGVTTFGSDGFTVGSLAQVNTNTEDYVAWCWSAGNSGSSNTVGTINTTTTFVDATAGISISTYTGDGNSGATVGHGLGVTPATVWVLPRSNGDNHLASNWESGVTAYSEKLKLNDYEAASSNTQITAASSTTFTLGTDVNVNGSGRTYVAYCFAEVEGFSRFGTYTGNGNADGPFVNCGFAPAFVVVKKTNSASNSSWQSWDTARTPNNLRDFALILNGADAEDGGGRDIDIVSNGFKPRNSNSNYNGSGDTFIYMAWAESPFKYATAR